MKARIHPTKEMQAAIDRYADNKIAEITAKAHEAVMKERGRHRHAGDVSLPAGLLSGWLVPPDVG